MKQSTDLTGKTYGMLKVLNLIPAQLDRKPMWCCRCQCGQVAIRSAYSLTSGRSYSCGCVSGRKQNKPVLPAVVSHLDKFLYSIHAPSRKSRR